MINNNLILVGLPGSGKSTIGRILASNLPLDFVDIDDAILKTYGVSPDWIIDLEGEASFYKRCLTLTSEILANRHALVAANSQSLILTEMKNLFTAEGLVIYLQHSYSSYQQIPNFSASNNQKTREMISTLDTLYAQDADIVVDAHQSAKEISKEIMQSLETRY